MSTIIGIFTLPSCKTLTNPEVIKIVDTFFDVACIVANAEIPDIIRDRLCNVPEKYKAKSHEVASSVRSEKRAYAAKQLKLQQESIDGGIVP